MLGKSPTASYTSWASNANEPGELMAGILTADEGAAAAGEGWVHDKRPAPGLMDGKCAAAPYVDNGKLVGLSRQRVD